MLEDREILQYYFTMNFDNLESKIGLNQKYIRNAYGSYKGAVCSKCSEPASEEELMLKITLGQVMRCKSCDGPIKPEITFYGEELKNTFNEACEIIADSEIRSFKISKNKIVDKMRAQIEKLKAESNYVEPDGKVAVKHVPFEDRGMTDLLIIIGPSTSL